MAGDTIPNRS